MTGVYNTVGDVTIAMLVFVSLCLHVCICVHLSKQILLATGK